MEFTKINTRSLSWDLFWGSFFLLSFFLVFLGKPPLAVPDEGNYAEIAREMFERQDFITPYLNGIKFFEKPVLLYWLGAFFFKIFGINLWAVRLPNALLSVLGCLLTYSAGRLLFDRLTGILAASILSTSFLYFILGHMFTTDLTVTVGITATLLFFLLGVSINVRYFLLAGLAAGLAVMAKGLIGVVLPAAVILGWMLMVRKYRFINSAYFWYALAIFFAVALPWHVVVALNNPEFLRFYFLEHHLARFSNGTVGHLQPFWYYVPILFLGFFPWSILLPQAIKSMWHAEKDNPTQNQVKWFLFIWMSIILVFFSISKAKLIPYILPAFPPMALIVGLYLKNLMVLNTIVKIRKLLMIMFVCGCALTIGLILFPYFCQLPNPPLAKFLLFSIAIIFLLGASLVGYFFEKNFMTCCLILIATNALIGLLLMQALPAMDLLSVKPLTDRLNKQLLDDDIIVGFNHHYQDLAFYLQKKVYILNSRKLFKFGMAHQADHDWMIDDTQFRKLWTGTQRVFAFIETRHFKPLDAKYQDLTFYVIGESGRYTVVGNLPYFKV